MNNYRIVQQRVKLFCGSSEEALEKSINDWIRDENPQIKCTQMSSSGTMNDSLICILISYILISHIPSPTSPDTTGSAEAIEVGDVTKDADTYVVLETDGHYDTRLDWEENGGITISVMTAREYDSGGSGIDDDLTLSPAGTAKLYEVLKARRDRLKDPK